MRDLSDLNELCNVQDLSLLLQSLHKLKKYSKIGQDFKNLISNFAFFLSRLATREATRVPSPLC